MNLESKLNGAKELKTSSIFTTIISGLLPVSLYFSGLEMDWFDYAFMGGLTFAGLEAAREMYVAYKQLIKEIKDETSNY